MSKMTTVEVCLDSPRAARLPLGESLRTMVDTMARWRCQFLHSSISRPVDGKYRCWTCLREFETDW